LARLSYKNNMEEFRVGDVIEFPGRHSKDIGVIVKVCAKTYLVELLHETLHLVETRGDVNIYEYFTYWPLNRSGKKTRVKKTCTNCVPAVYDDPGRKNFTAGVWRVVEDGEVTLYSHRITGNHYHHRIGANRERDRRERQDDCTLQLSPSQRTSLSKARNRRLVEQGKREFFHEILANRRLFADLQGDGRDFVSIFEHSSGGGVGGNAHRMPACEEFQRFMAEFTLVGSMSGYNTSQMCSRCGHRLEYANKREIRTKVCKSKECSKLCDSTKHDQQQCSRSGYFFMDRYFFHFNIRSFLLCVLFPLLFSDVNAGVNFVLIDEAEARGEDRPLRFQSDYYKRGRSSILPH
jgi:hypothetical protein